jgi:hypothetical protein
MMDTMNKKAINITLPEDLLKEAKIQAVREDRTLLKPCFETTWKNRNGGVNPKSNGPAVLQATGSLPDQKANQTQDDW